VLLESRSALQKIWSETSYRMQSLRDNPNCARQQYDSIDADDPGLNVELSFDPADTHLTPALLETHPRIAILREQGVNGHVEMAAAFDRAGFEAIDVHMSDLSSGRHDLQDFTGLVACGGFSYGDVLGAGGGWAKSILFNAQLKDMFQQFFENPSHFGLGVCNGCQMFSHLRELIPGANHWPTFQRNVSDQFEARVSLVEIMPSPSIFMSDMVGSKLPVAVAHGEGRAEFSDDINQVLQSELVAIRYVDHHGAVTEQYPMNPNGSPLGITGLTNIDGRFTIMMPHPERCFRSVQNSWHPQQWGEDAPWLRMFLNARKWVG
jgi:phosphoribosylformylglycinamidine synthase